MSEAVRTAWDTVTCLPSPAGLHISGCHLYTILMLTVIHLFTCSHPLCDTSLSMSYINSVILYSLNYVNSWKKGSPSSATHLDIYNISLRKQDVKDTNFLSFIYSYLIQNFTPSISPSLQYLPVSERNFEYSF